VDFGGATFANAGFFVAKFDPTGAPVWSKGFTNGHHNDHGTGVAVDAAGNVLVTGDFTGSIDFGGGALASTGAYDMFIAKFDPSGAHLWSKRFTSNDKNAIYGVATDTSGNVVFTGTLANAVDFGGGTLTPTGRDLFIAKFDPSGAHLWSKTFHGSDHIYPWGTAVDALGSVYVACEFCGSVDLGSAAFAAEDCTRSNAFLASFDLDPCGHVIIAGSFGGMIDLAGIPLSSFGGQDVFAAAFAR
jgi:hypothetical protein